MMIKVEKRIKWVEKNKFFSSQNKYNINCYLKLFIIYKDEIVTCVTNNVYYK